MSLNNAILKNLGYTDEDLVEVAMEGFDFASVKNFAVGFFTKVTSVLSDESASLNNKALRLNFLDNTGFKTSVNNINKLGRTALTTYTVCAPAYIDKDLPAYVETLHQALDTLSNIDNLLLKPLEQWLAICISKPETLYKVWINLDPHALDYKKHNDELMKHFNQSVDNGIHNRLFIDLYGDVEGYEKCFKQVTLLIDTASKVNTAEITARLKRLLDYITKLTSSKEHEQILKELPEAKLEQLREYILNCAKALELFSIVLFQVKLVGYAQSETSKKINKDLA